MGGDIHKVECSGKIIAMAGIRPCCFTSPANNEGKGRITKRGNRHLPEDHLADDNQCDPIHRYFSCLHLKRRKEGLPYKKAVLATASQN